MFNQIRPKLVGFPTCTGKQPAESQDNGKTSTKIIELDSDRPITNDASWRLETTLPVQFTVKFSPNLLSPSNTDLLQHGVLGQGARRLVIIDQEVDNLYGDRIRSYFDAHRIPVQMLPVLSDETTKNLDTLLEILEAMEQFALLRRNEPIIAIGGGVLLDIAGMAASMYRRGVPYIRVPTTLLGIVDASVGAKVAVNHFERRNRLGAYYPPVAAYLDPSFLITLADNEISNGLSEIIKMGLIKDERLFRLIENNAPSLRANKFQCGSEAIEIVCRSIEGMIDELEPNLWEKNLERIVDFGHSFSPLIEMKALPELSHGEAVALDMLFSCIVAEGRGLMTSFDRHRVFKTIERSGLPTYHHYFGKADVIEAALKDTMKHRNGDQNLPLPTVIGKAVFINDLSYEEIARASAIMEAGVL